ncbi:MAG: PPOX class F420-dependent oxidoreductase [Chloroflexi bacterium]|nr:PPOX class F420-dependent oxidoreductase [Chloroflexota bacterium]
MNSFDQFTRQKYLNLETFRQNGAGVKTPVWFAQEGEMLYVITMTDAGKVKRIRRDGRVNVAVCRMDGSVTGAWVPAQACENPDPAVLAKINRLFDRKYGLVKKFFERQRSSRGSRDTVLEIKLIEEEQR